MRWAILFCLSVVVGCGAFPAAADLQSEIRHHDIFVGPEGPGPSAIVLMLHGCGGLSGRDRMWAERLRGWGYASLRVNSLAPRGLRSVCAGTSLRPEERVPDVVAALAALQDRPSVDRNRIAVMGWSHGASATLWALSGAPAATLTPVRAAIAYYPGCSQVPAWKVDTPVLMLLGGADDWAAAGPCQGLVRRQQQAGRIVEQVTYPGAHHGFDNPLLGPAPRRIAEARGGRGATIQYDAAAAEDSARRVQQFLRRTLGPTRGT